MFTKSPFTYQGTDIRLSAATYNDYKASLTHYHRISSQFAFSTGLFYEHKGGFFKNNFNNKRIDTDDEFGGRFRAIYLPSENLKLDFTLNYEYTNQEDIHTNIPDVLMARRKAAVNISEKYHTTVNVATSVTC